MNDSKVPSTVDEAWQAWCIQVGAENGMTHVEVPAVSELFRAGWNAAVVAAKQALKQFRDDLAGLK